MTSTLITMSLFFFKGWMFIWGEKKKKRDCHRVRLSLSHRVLFCPIFFFDDGHMNSSGIFPFCRTSNSSKLDAPRLVNEFVRSIFPGHHFMKTVVELHFTDCSNINL